MKRSDKDSCGYICFLLVFIFLLITFLIFLSNEEFYKKINESSGIATWFQGLATLLAIFGVWWQTRKQIDNLKETRNEEELKKKSDTLVRVQYILKESRASCEKIFEFYEKHTEFQKFFLKTTSINQTISMPLSGNSDIPEHNYQQYKDVLSTTILHLLNIPYWDIVDAHYANKLMKIQNQARLCILILDYDPNRFIVNLRELVEMIEVLDVN